MTYLELHKEWMEEGELPCGGLCNFFSYGPTVLTMPQELIPTKQERGLLKKEGFCSVYWASGLPDGHEDENTGYTPLRQTLVLLMAALNGEFD